jgi:hypothetical protein
MLFTGVISRCASADLEEQAGSSPRAREVMIRRGISLREMCIQFSGPWSFHRPQKYDEDDPSSLTRGGMIRLRRGWEQRKMAAPLIGQIAYIPVGRSLGNVASVYSTPEADFNVMLLDWAGGGRAEGYYLPGVACTREYHPLGPISCEP